MSVGRSSVFQRCMRVVKVLLVSLRCRCNKKNAISDAHITGEKSRRNSCIERKPQISRFIAQHLPYVFEVFAEGKTMHDDKSKFTFLIQQCEASYYHIAIKIACIYINCMQAVMNLLNCNIRRISYDNVKATVDYSVEFRKPMKRLMRGKPRVVDFASVAWPEVSYGKVLV